MPSTRSLSSLLGRRRRRLWTVRVVTSTRVFLPGIKRRGRLIPLRSRKTERRPHKNLLSGAHFVFPERMREGGGTFAAEGEVSYREWHFLTRCGTIGRLWNDLLILPK